VISIRYIFVYHVYLWLPLGWYNCWLTISSRHYDKYSGHDMTLIGNISEMLGEQQVWRYQNGNQKPQFEGQTKREKDEQWSTIGKLMLRVNSSCSTSGTHHVTLDCDYDKRNTSMVNDDFNITTRKSCLSCFIVTGNSLSRKSWHGPQSPLEYRMN